jgi:uncharacterized RDD family membrane protein YckC
VLLVGVGAACLAIAVALKGEGSLWLLGAWLLLMFLVNWGYFAVLEIVMGGQTLGKRALSMRVVGLDGGAPSTAALVVRNLLRGVDNFIGVILVAVDPMARRLGDRLAGTVVVHDRSQRRPTLVIGRTPGTWGAPEVAVVEAFLERAETLEPARAELLARRILAWVERDQANLLDGLDSSHSPVVQVRRALRVESQ